MTARASRVSTLAILALAAAMRVPLVFSGLPYIGYIDEGGVLHRVMRLVRTGDWDPGWYQYPSLSMYLTTAVLRASSPIYRLVTGRPLSADIPADADLYDLIAPPIVILAGRGIVLLASLVTVLLGMALAGRLAGSPASLAAGLLLAVTPALVQRAAIVITDTLSTAFALGVLVVSEDLRSVLRMEGTRSAVARRHPIQAGILAGFAAATKYPAGAVFVVILAAVFGPGALSLNRLRLVALSALAAAGAMLLAMPALVLSTLQVVKGLLAQTHDYATFSHTPGLFRQALFPEELGWPLALAGLLGLALLARRRETLPTVVSWVVFGVLLLGPLLRYGFQPFRNALPFVPPLLIAAAALLFPAQRRPSAVRAALGGLGLLVILVSFVPGWKWTFRERRVRDSRTAFIDWLVTKARPDHRLLFVRELAFLPKELERVKADVVVAAWAEARTLIEGGGFDAVVYPSFDLAGALPGVDAPIADLHRFQSWLETLKIEARFGSAPTPIYTNFWRTNDELILLAIRWSSGEPLRRERAESAP